MKTEHTPGPWHIGKDTRIIGANSQRVAVCDNNEATPGLVNAALIAAAPELLAALNGILPFIAQSSASEGGAVKYSAAVRAADAVRAAIARARGEA